MQKVTTVNGKVRLDPRLISLIWTPETKHFADAAHALLTKHGADVQLVEAKVTTFPFGEPHVELKERVRNSVCFVFANPAYPTVCEGLVRLMVLLNALQHAAPDRAYIVAPFVPFTRQDRKSEHRGPVSIQLLRTIIEEHAMVRGLMTVDIHAPQSLAIFRRIVPDDLKARRLLVTHLEGHFRNHEQLVIEAPDIGAAKRAEKTAFSVGPMVPYGIFDKRRTRKAGATVSSYHGPDLTGMDVVFIDDMIDTGGTLIVTAQEAFKRRATSVTACATHALLSPRTNLETGALERAEDKLRASGIRVIVTNSIYRTPEYYAANADWLTVVSLEPLLADAVFQSCQMGGSLKDHSE